MFSLKDYFLIFECFNSAPSDLNNNYPTMSIAPPPGDGNCYCRSNSWCGSATGSDLAVCLWNDEGSSCSTTSGGCGILNLLNCRGVCCVGGNCAS